MSDPARFALARFFLEELGRTVHRLQEVERLLEVDPSGHGPAPPSTHVVESVTAEAVEAASIACLGGEVGMFPVDEVVAMLESHRSTFDWIANRLVRALPGRAFSL